MRLTRPRLAVVAATIAAVIALTATPAAADRFDDTSGGGGDVNADGLAAWAHASHTRPSISGGSAPPCTAPDPEDPDGTVDGTWSLHETRVGEEGWRNVLGEDRPGVMRRLECRPPDPGDLIGEDGLCNACYISGGSQIILIPEVDATVLPEIAFDSLGIGDPPVATSPGLDQRHLVNLESWLWLEPGYWQARDLTVTALWFTVTARAEPVEARWAMGDGATVVCDGPGTPYDASRPSRSQSTDCSHTYRQAAPRYDGEVTVVWAGTVNVNGAVTDLGTTERSSSFGLAVTESQAVVTGR